MSKPGIVSDEITATVHRTVADYGGAFPTVDQMHDRVARLAAERAGCRLRQIGNSRLGEPLWLLSTGSGDRHTLVIAGVHPNEPVGFHTVLALAEALGRRPALARGTWHFMPVLDPDAVRLNRWYQDEPLTVRGYYRGFYRPPLGAQPTWTFPVCEEPRRFQRPLPETWAVMRVIDELQPALVIDLHNIDFGSAWFAVNQHVDGLGEVLRSVAADVGLQLEDAPIDAVGWESSVPGVYVVPHPKATGATSGVSRPLPHGASIAYHVLSTGAVSISPEIPMWRTNTTPQPPQGHHKAFKQVVEELTGSAGLLQDGIDYASAQMTVRSPFEAAARDALASAHTFGARALEYGSEVTPALYGTVCRSVHAFRLRAAGMILRALDAERAAGNESPTVHTASTELEQRFGDWCAACETTLRPRLYPVEDLVLVQAKTALIAARHLDRIRP